MSTLYIVSTPIGHLSDVTHRALEVLGSVQRVLAEDTRRTSVLMRRYGLETPLTSLHEHNEASRTEAVLAWLRAGEDLALVSDAGTPLISDPGARMVRAVLDDGHDVMPVPGPSALLAALVASGFEPVPFTFVGFLPRTGRARTEALQRIAGSPHTVVLYEAPGRLARLLDALRDACGPGRRVVVAREMTKIHETFVRGTLDEASRYYEAERVRGEVVVVLEGMAMQAPPASASDAQQLAQRLLGRGGKRSAVARELTRRLGLPREEAYRIALASSDEAGREAD
jgi:16S rRNA (cytidine1402-2'-O)-methyltransferase